jgi:hypothetical protein
MIDDLSNYERVIQESLRPESFYELGQALANIRDRKMYQGEFGSFPAYCRARWDMAKRTAYQYISASAVVDTVRNCALVLPANESQARPLTRLVPEEQRLAWVYICKSAPDGKITAEFIERAVEKIFPRRINRSKKGKKNNLKNILSKSISFIEQLNDYLNGYGSQTTSATEIKRLLTTLIADKPQFISKSFAEGICIFSNTNIPGLTIEFKVYRSVNKKNANNHQFRQNRTDYRRKESGENDPYRILGIRRDASQDEIKSAHRRLAKQYHTDRLNNLNLSDDHRWVFAEAEERMKQVNWAYGQIKN